MSDDPPTRSVSPDPPVIDAALARRLVDSQFPQWSDLPITAVEFNGWDNRSFRLGSELTIRLPSGNWYAQQVDKEQRWLPVLAPQLPLPIPTPGAKGAPGSGFPYPWSVYRWLEGDLASQARIGDLDGFATTLARFLGALGRVGATGGPEPGQHNFFRGGPLVTSPPGTCWSATSGSRRCSTSVPPVSAIPRATRSSPGRSCRARPGTGSEASLASIQARGRAAAAGRCGRR